MRILETLHVVFLIWLSSHLSRRRSFRIYLSLHRHIYLFFFRIHISLSPPQHIHLQVFPSSFLHFSVSTATHSPSGISFFLFGKFGFECSWPFLFRSLLCQLIEHEHGFEIVNFSLLLQVIRGNSVVTVEVLQIQVFKCKLTIVKWPDKCKYGVIYIIIDMLSYIYKNTILLIWNFNSQFKYNFFILFNPFSFKHLFCLLGLSLMKFILI